MKEETAEPENPEETYHVNTYFFGIFPRSFATIGLRSATGCGKTQALYQGTTSQLAEKLLFLKGTAFRPYINA